VRSHYLLEWDEICILISNISKKKVAIPAVFKLKEMLLMGCGQALGLGLIGAAFFPLLIVVAVIAAIAYVVLKKKEETEK